MTVPPEGRDRRLPGVAPQLSPRGAEPRTKVSKPPHCGPGLKSRAVEPFGELGLWEEEGEASPACAGVMLVLGEQRQGCEEKPRVLQQHRSTDRRGSSSLRGKLPWQTKSSFPAHRSCSKQFPFRVAFNTAQYSLEQPQWMVSYPSRENLVFR